jgi:glutamine synthetase
MRLHQGRPAAGRARGAVRLCFRAVEEGTTSGGAARIRMLYPDLLGLERGKYVVGDPGGAATGFAVAVYNLTLDKEILHLPGLPYDAGFPDMEAHLDPETLRPGWEPRTLVGMATVTFDGRPPAVDPRHVLRRAVEAWERMGLAPQLSCELEFYLLEPDGAGGWRSIDAPGARVYGTGSAVDPTGVVDEIVRAAEGSGFRIEAWGSEFDTAQFEVNLAYRDAVPACDDGFLFRLLAREVAARRGYRATFLGRPFPDRSGCGLHLNMSFRREDGSNALEDPSAPDGLSALAHRSIAGMLAHHRALAAICAPHVNAYRRLRPDMFNGYWANWGYDDRTVGIRVPPARGARTRLEHRMADAAANPYLVAAALLHAARLGVEGELEPPEPQPPGGPPATDVRVPDTLAEALDRFEEDAELRAALGEEVSAAFVALKRAEWERYAKAVEDPATGEVTAWELSYYLPYF